jgi:hypothetical protein
MAIRHRSGFQEKLGCTSKRMAAASLSRVIQNGPFSQ